MTRVQSAKSLTPSKLTVKFEVENPGFNNLMNEPIQIKNLLFNLDDQSNIINYNNINSFKNSPLNNKHKNRDIYG